MQRGERGWYGMARRTGKERYELRSAGAWRVGTGWGVGVEWIGDEAGCDVLRRAVMG